jgi:hypothetical protein
MNYSAALASQTSLANYIDIWSRLPLHLVSANPFDAVHLTPNLQEGFRTGAIQSSDLPLTAAQYYVARARSYEQALLDGLGLPSEYVTAFAEQREDFGDHFQTSRYPWQENTRAAGVAIAELTVLHESLSTALGEVKGWKRSIGFFPDGADYVDLQKELKEPLTSLQELLVERATHALNVRETYDVNIEAGLQAYFGRYRRRHSGVQMRLIAAGIRVSDSTPPPALAVG